MKWAYLEKRSMMVRTMDLLPTFGNASMKSIEISLHTSNGTGSGWKTYRVKMLRFIVLTCCASAHELTHLVECMHVEE